MTKRKRYTEVEILAIIQKRKDGKTEAQIAEELDRPLNSVHCKLKELRKDGRLPLVWDLTKMTPEDLTELAGKHLTTVEFVNDVVKVVGSELKSKLPLVDEAIFQWNVQKGCCAYYGVAISLTASSTNPIRAVLSNDKNGKPLWVSHMAGKMRGKLSHEMFLTAIQRIYRYVFTGQV